MRQLLLFIIETNAVGVRREREKGRGSERGRDKGRERERVEWKSSGDRFAY